MGSSDTHRSFTDRYDVEDEIGRGGMAVVHRVFDRTLGRRVAMKVVHAEGDPTAIAALRGEARIIARLDHPGIVPIYDVQEESEGATTRVLMKLVEGRSLAALLEEEVTPPPSGLQLAQLLQILIKVCDAVAFAHSRGVIHRDLTPANVMVGNYGQVYVTDWGLALLRDRPDASEGRAATLSGTPSYMAPEQTRGQRQNLGPATDVFGLGGILYHVLTLCPPWQGASVNDVIMQAAAGFVPPPTSVIPNRVLPAGLCRIAMKALARDPAERHASVDALKNEIEAFLHGGGWFDVATFPRGSIILHEGDPGVTAYIVVAGTCEIYRVVDGEKDHLRTVGPGEVFGEVAFFTGALRSATVEATTDVSVLVVTRAALERELEQSSWMRAFVRAAIDRFVELDRT